MLCLMVCTSSKYHLLSEIWLLLFTVQVSRHITKNQHFGGTGEGAGNQLTCEAVTTSGTEDCRGKRRERERGSDLSGGSWRENLFFGKKDRGGRKKSGVEARAALLHRFLSFF
jgi:hypothetical protein